MPRKIIYDIKPISRIKKRQAEPEIVEESPPNDISSGGYYVSQPPVSHRPILWLIVVGCIVFLITTLAFLFDGTKITIEPRVETVSIDHSFSAEKSTTKEDALPFEITILEDTVEKTVPGETTKEVTRKATGEVRIFNNHSTSAQKLLIETRLEAVDGKIYKTDKAVVVPGQRIENGKTIPGSVEVSVTADEAGPSYNMDLSDFAIFGFKGSPKFKTFYARSTTPMSGGFTGVEYVVSEEESEALKISLLSDLKDKLLSKMQAEIPDTFFFYTNATFFESNNFEISSDTESGSVKGQISGSVAAVLFAKDALAKAITQKTISQYEGEPVRIPDLENLGFNLENKERLDILEVNKIIFSLKGNSTIVWLVDEDLLKTTLIGQKKKDFPGLLEQFSFIKKAEVSVRPFWKGTISQEEKDISIINTRQDLLENMIDKE